MGRVYWFRGIPFEGGGDGATGQPHTPRMAVYGATMAPMSGVGWSHYGFMSSNCTPVHFAQAGVWRLSGSAEGGRSLARADRGGEVFDAT